MIAALMKLAEAGRLPDVLIRLGIRLLDRIRIRQEAAGSVESRSRRRMELIESLRKGPIAEFTEDANQQHYEVPTALFQTILGPRMKYSCCHWPHGVDDLAGAEEAALEQVCRRAGIADGMRVLDLGCGWGSLTLWIAERYPGCEVTAASNSRTQTDFIRATAESRGLANVRVVKSDVNELDSRLRSDGFDRVCSLEMFEHMHNYRRLLQSIREWMTGDGKLFVHVFSHRTMAYRFELGGPADWMGRYFFTGGLMPSDDLLLHFQDDLVVERHWNLGGLHYARTLEAWLRKLDAARNEVMPILRSTYGPTEAETWFHRWRMFLLACSELMSFRGGTEWMISHYLFRPRADGEATR
jgi:cyclopropane-fatty-acyl-phospholipid synthase